MQQVGVNGFRFNLMIAGAIAVGEAIGGIGGLGCLLLSIVLLWYLGVDVLQR